MIATERLVLHEARDLDAAAVAAYDARNEARFERFDPAGAAGAIAAGYTLLAALHGEPTRVAGVVGFSGISSDPDPSALFSFSIDGDCEGLGLAYEMTAAAIAHARSALGIRTLIAHHHPENQRSAALLARLGFHTEARLLDVPAAIAHLARPQVMATLRLPAQSN